jgi:hypothetical protein
MPLANNTAEAASISRREEVKGTDLLVMDFSEVKDKDAASCRSAGANGVSLISSGKRRQIGDLVNEAIRMPIVRGREELQPGVRPSLGRTSGS